jgi:hypothetical protein
MAWKDTFTDTTNTPLSSHSSDDGFSWTRLVGTGLGSAGSGTLDIVGGVLQLGSVPGNGGGNYNFNSPATTADCSVKCSFLITTTGRVIEIGLRGGFSQDGSGNLITAYVAKVDYTTSPPFVRLARGPTAVGVALGSFNISALPLSTWHSLELKAIGNTLLVLLNGTVVIGPVTDNTFSAGGLTAVQIVGTAGTAQVDDFEVQPTADTITLAALVGVATRSRATFGATQLGSAGGNGAAPIEGQLWPRGQKSG